MSRVGGKLYMFGGYDGIQCFNDVEILDIDTMTWLKPNISDTLPMSRNAHTISVIGTKLYLFGGHSGMIIKNESEITGNKHLTDLHIFDSQTLTWTEFSTIGTPPKGLRGHTANLIGDKIYLFGGYDGRGRFSLH
jgi:leucine-zipper-like transcriptional regulator 1